MFESKDLNRHKGKYYGLYRGYVVDNKDPEGMGRLKVSVPAVLGIDDETEKPLISGWAYPKFPVAGNGWGLNLIPPIKNPDGSNVMVWVEFEQGDVDYPVWSGCPIQQNGLSKETKTNQTKINSGTTKKPTFSFSTPDGRKIVLDDANQKLIISDYYKVNGKTNKVEHTITFSGETIEIKCNDVTKDDKTKILMNTNSITMQAENASSKSVFTITPTKIDSQENISK